MTATEISQTMRQATDEILRLRQTNKELLEACKAAWDLTHRFPEYVPANKIEFYKELTKQLAAAIQKAQGGSK